MDVFVLVHCPFEGLSGIERWTRNTVCHIGLVNFWGIKSTKADLISDMGYVKYLLQIVCKRIKLKSTS